MESVDWARNKCPLSAMTGVRIKRVVYKENIRAFTKFGLSAVYRSILIQSNHYNEDGHYFKSLPWKHSLQNTGTCIVTNA